MGVVPTFGVCRQIAVTDLEGAACSLYGQLPARTRTPLWLRGPRVLTGGPLSRGSAWLWWLPVLPSALNLQLRAQRRRALGHARGLALDIYFPAFH